MAIEGVHSTSSFSTVVLSSLYRRDHTISRIALAAISLGIVGLSLTFSSFATNYIMHTAFAQFTPYIASIAALVGMIGWCYIGNGLIPDLFYQSAEKLFEEALDGNQTAEARASFMRSVVLRIGIGHLVDYGASLGSFAGFFFSLFSPTFILRSVESLERLSLATFNTGSFLWHSSKYSMLMLSNDDAEHLLEIASNIKGTPLNKQKLFHVIHQFFLGVRKNRWHSRDDLAQELLVKLVYKSFSQDDFARYNEQLFAISSLPRYKTKLQELCDAHPQGEQ